LSAPPPKFEADATTLLGSANRGQDAQPGLGGDSKIVAMKKKSKRGFASMDPDKQRAIAIKGGRAAHAKGKAHEFTSEEARVAGAKGGRVTASDREHMAEIGRKGAPKRKRKNVEKEGDSE
jgi:general stress protein YciG